MSEVGLYGGQKSSGSAEIGTSVSPWLSAAPVPTLPTVFSGPMGMGPGAAMASMGGKACHLLPATSSVAIWTTKRGSMMRWVMWPGRYCSPPHRMPFNSINEGPKRVG